MGLKEAALLVSQSLQYAMIFIPFLMTLKGSKKYCSLAVCMFPSTHWEMDPMIQPGGEGPWRPKRPAPWLVRTHKQRKQRSATLFPHLFTSQLHSNIFSWPRDSTMQRIEPCPRQPIPDISSQLFGLTSLLWLLFATSSWLLFADMILSSSFLSFLCCALVDWRMQFRHVLDAKVPNKEEIIARQLLLMKFRSSSAEWLLSRPGPWTFSCSLCKCFHLHSWDSWDFFFDI